MQAPTLKPNDFCVCLDDPWTGMRSLAVEKIKGERVTVRPDGLPSHPVATEVIAADRLVYNPYRNAVRRMGTHTDATVEQTRQLHQADLVRVVTANVTADRQPVELAELKRRIAVLLPEFPSDFVEVCLRAMTASSALRAEPPKTSGTAPTKAKMSPTKSKTNKIKLRASDDMIRGEQSSAFAYSFADELLNQSRRFGRLVVHRGTTGGFREELLRALLRRSLAERHHVATGFIDGCDLQLDVIIYDRIEYAPVFREGDLVVVPMDSVRAILEVKTRLTTTLLDESLEHLSSLPLELEAPIFKGIFAFETDIPDDKLLGYIAKFYEKDTTIWAQPFEEVTAVCVLERQLALSGYARNPRRPVLSLLRNLMGRNFQAAVFLDVLQDYLRTPAPRALPRGLPWRTRIEMGATSRDYLAGMWQVAMEDNDLDEEGGTRARTLERVERTLRWLAGNAPW